MNLVGLNVQRFRVTNLYIENEGDDFHVVDLTGEITVVDGTILLNHVSNFEYLGYNYCALHYRQRSSQ